MQRYFLDQQNQIQKDDVHHILNVMRFKTGTEVEMCGIDGCYLSKLMIQDKIVQFEMIKQLESNPPLNVTIVQGLPKGDKLDTVVKYATLFQAQSIVFMTMVRSIAKISNTAHKLERLNKIAKEAAELSKRSTLPNIEFIDKLSALDLVGKKVILLDEMEKDKTLKDVYLNTSNLALVVIIGPEGGIDQAERNTLISLGAIPISLGQSILPTELAHIPILNACLLKKL
jgi:16S rRNA (uracil1498-N3)-methyltransferase